MEKRILKIASGFLVLGILYVIINICSIICFSYVDETAPTDAAIVLGAAVDEAGEPSAVLKPASTTLLCCTAKVRSKR